MRNQISATVLAAVLLVSGVTLGVTQSDKIQSLLSSNATTQAALTPATQTDASSDVQGSLQISSAGEQIEGQTLSAALNEQAPAAGTEATPVVTAPASTEVAAPAAEAPKAEVNAAPKDDNVPVMNDTSAADATAALIDKTKAAQSAYTFDVDKALQDHEIGSPMAPITVYDYSSLTCPHCGAFHSEIFPKVKENYIDKGKIRWVYRTYPLNDLAIRAEMVARCAPNDQYLKLRDLMFNEQRKWAFDDQGLNTLGMLVRVAGITEEMFTSCINNKELEAGIAKIAQDGTDRYKISSTPTFIFNDGVKKLAGAGSYEGFASEADNLLQEMADAKHARENSTPIPAGKLETPAAPTAQ